MSDWISIFEQQPEEEQKVIYFFDICGVFRGQYAEVKYDYEGHCVDENGDAYIGHQFYNEKGFLTDDVTHWMPDNGQPLPPPPEDE
jgi:hypothetical protein